MKVVFALKKSHDTKKEAAIFATSLFKFKINTIF
jgi:hypothetical protein